MGWGGGGTYCRFAMNRALAAHGKFVREAENMCRSDFQARKSSAFRSCSWFCNMYTNIGVKGQYRHQYFNTSSSSSSGCTYPCWYFRQLETSQLSNDCREPLLPMLKSLDLKKRPPESRFCSTAVTAIFSDSNSNNEGTCIVLSLELIRENGCHILFSSERD